MHPDAHCVKSANPLRVSKSEEVPGQELLCLEYDKLALAMQARLLRNSSAADGLNFDHAYSTCFALVEGGTAPFIL